MKNTGMRIGIDLGGTKIEALAIDGQGMELKRHRIDTPRGDYDATIQEMAGLVRRLEQATGRIGTVGAGISWKYFENHWACEELKLHLAKRSSPRQRPL